MFLLPLSEAFIISISSYQVVLLPHIYWSSTINVPWLSSASRCSLIISCHQSISTQRPLLMLSRTISGAISLIHTTVISEIPSTSLIEIPQKKKRKKERNPSNPQYSLFVQPPFIYCSETRVSSVQFSHSVVSESLQPHESQHARPPCPSPTPGVHSDASPSSQ